METGKASVFAPTAQRGLSCPHLQPLPSPQPSPYLISLPTPHAPAHPSAFSPHSLPSPHSPAHPSFPALTSAHCPPPASCSSTQSGSEREPRSLSRRLRQDTDSSTRDTHPAICGQSTASDRPTDRPTATAPTCSRRRARPLPGGAARGARPARDSGGSAPRPALRAPGQRHRARPGPAPPPLPPPLPFLPLPRALAAAHGSSRSPQPRARPSPGKTSC